MENYILGRDGTLHLAHHGRKGMKWYQHIFGDVDPRAEYKVGGTNIRGEKTYGTKNIHEATDKELRDQINRKNLENEYLNKVNPKHEGACQKMLSKVGNKLMEKAAEEVASRTMKYVSKKLDAYSDGAPARREQREQRNRERSEARERQEQARRYEREMRRRAQQPRPTSAPIRAQGAVR